LPFIKWGFALFKQSICLVFKSGVCIFGLNTFLVKVTFLRDLMESKSLQNAFLDFKQTPLLNGCTVGSLNNFVGVYSSFTKRYAWLFLFTVFSFLVSFKVRLQP